MRDRVTEFLPLLLAGAVLLVFQLTRGGGLAPPSTSSGAGLSPTAQSTSAANTPPTLAQRRLPLAPSPTVAVVAADGLCNSAQPRFGGGMVTLKVALGASMGEPLECERSVDDQGNTQQKTSTGLAYYRRQTNYACFTTGWDHWGIVDGSIVHWAGDAVDPPSDAVGVSH